MHRSRCGGFGFLSPLAESEYLSALTAALLLLAGPLIAAEVTVDERLALASLPWRKGPVANPGCPSLGAQPVFFLPCSS